MERARVKKQVSPSHEKWRETVKRLAEAGRIDEVISLILDIDGKPPVSKPVMR